MAIDWGRSLGGGGAAPAQPTPSPKGINWGSALGAKVAPETLPSPINKQEQSTLKSFKSLPASNRSATLKRLDELAKKGDAAAKRKLTLLAGEIGNDLPKEQDYKPKDMGSKLGATLYGVGKDIASSLAVTGKTIATTPHAIDAAGIAIGSMIKGEKGEALEKSKQRALDEARKTPFASSFGGKTVQDVKNTSTSKSLAGIGGTTLENVLNVYGGGVAGQAGKGVVKQSGKELLKTAGRTAKEGALIGGASGVAQAGKEGETNLGKIAGEVGAGAALGGALGGGIPVAGAAVKGVAKGLAEGVSKVGGKGNQYVNANRAVEEAARTESARTGEKVSVVRERILNDEDSFNQAKRQYQEAHPEANLSPVVEKATSQTDAPVYQNVDETLGTPEASSRVKQYNESLQKTIQGIERAPGYQEELSAKGGGETISNKETYRKAMEAGPLDEATIKDWQAGQAVDSVTLVRAKATLDSAARDFTDLWESGKIDYENLDAAAEHLAKLEAGYHVMSAEPGRATQIQNSFIDEAYKRAEKLRKLINETKGPKREEIIQKGIDEFDREAQKAIQSGTWSKDTALRIVKMVEEYATAAKLTSPLTHAINFGSTLLNYPVKAAENTVTTLLGAAQGKTNIGQLRYSVFGSTQGTKSAVRQLATEVKQALHPGAKDLTPDGSKVEVSQGIPGKAGKVIRTPFNMLQAADNFWKSMLTDSELHMRAYEKAYQEGYRGTPLTGRIKELVGSPTDDMVKRAEEVAKEWTFTTELGPIGNAATKLLGKIPGAKLLVPFVATPTNVLKFQAQRHPIGIVSPRNINALMKGSNLERREAVARLTVGAGMATAGVMTVLELGDNITGAAPSDKGERDLFYGADGKKPFAIKIGGRWVQYNRFQPVGLYLSQAVGVRDKMHEIQKKGERKGVHVDEMGSLFTALGVSTAKALGELPFIAGTTNLIEALSDPTDLSVNKLTGGILTGLIPNVGRDIASAGDTVQRVSKSPSDQIKTMIPWKRQDLPERITTFGEPQKQSGGPAERGFVKITSTGTSSKLAEALKEAKYYPDPPKEEQRGKKLSQDQYQQFLKESGRGFASKLEAAINDPDYQGLETDRKAKTLETALSDARSEALDNILGKAEEKKKTAKVKKYQ
jgi:hypothetical protein